MRQKRASRESTHARRTRERRQTRAVALASLALLGAMLTGGTVAFLTSSTNDVTNSFEPAQVSCEVLDGYFIKNTSDVHSYVRATVTVNWMDADGNLYGQAPVRGSDYSLELDASGEWIVDAADGNYYFKTPVAPGAMISPDLFSLSQIAEDPAGYTLKAQVVAEAIQAVGGYTEGSDFVYAVEDAWSSDKVTISVNEGEADAVSDDSISVVAKN